MKILDQKGQGLTEYIMLMLLVCLISVGIVGSLGKAIKSKLEVAKDHINKEITLGDKKNSNESSGRGGFELPF